MRNRAVDAHVPIDFPEMTSILGTELVEMLRERCGAKAVISLVHGFLLAALLCRDCLRHGAPLRVVFVTYMGPDRMRRTHHNRSIEPEQSDDGIGDTFS